MKLKIFLILTLLLISSCDKPTEPIKTDFTNYRYPLELGSKWVYEKSVKISNVKPDSMKSEIPLYSGTVTVEIVGIDSTKAVIPTFKFDILSMVIVNEVPIYESSVFYYNNTDTGLIQFAYEGSSLIVPVAGYSHLPQDMIEKRKDKKESTAIDDSKIALKYPVKVNEEWNYTNIEYLFSISKKIKQFEDFPLENFTVPCFIVEWQYTGIDVQVLDYYTIKGLYKRIISTSGLEYVDESSPNTLATYDLVEAYTLLWTN